MNRFSPDAIEQAVRLHAEDIVSWTEELIRRPSENRPPDGNEAVLQDFIEEECEKIDGTTDSFNPLEVPGIQEHPFWLKGRTFDSKRRNVVARWNGTGGGKSILFSGHADVAPFEPDNWEICRPFEPVRKDGKLYGRGSADMKTGLAAGYWAIRILQELNFQPAGDVLFESVVDEEFASGNGTLASRLRGHNTDLAIVTEPTQMHVCPACFGAFLGDLVLSGQAGMPYTGTAIPNPINGAARVVELFAEWQEKWRAENHHPLFEGPGKELNIVLWQIDSHGEGEFVQMGTPLQTRIAWIVWCHPGMTETEFYDRFRRYWEEHARTDPALKPFALDLRSSYHYVRPWETPADSKAVASVCEAFRRAVDSSSRVPIDGPVVSGATFSCDLAVYGEVGKMPSLLLGPRGGSLHAPDEWVLLEDILTLTSILANAVVLWSG